ncbi:MAG: MMPL family transporter [Candidatus Limnocylindria bacterium]
MSQATVDRTTQSRFARLARACYGHPWRVIGAWVLILVGVSIAAGALGKRDSSNFRLSGTDSQRAFDLLAARFPAQKGDSDQLVFAVRGSGGTLGDAPLAARARATLAEVGRLPHVASVGRLSPSRDGRVAVAPVTYDDTVDKLELDDLKKVISTARGGATSALQVEVGGQGAEFARQEGPGASGFIGLLAALVVLLFTFGSIIAAGVPILSAVFALGSAVGLIAVGSHVIDTPDFATQLAELIGLGVGIDYALLVLTRYRSEVARGADRAEGAVRAIDTAGRTVVFAAATVIIALLGMFALGLSFLNGVALGAALAVALTMLAALTLLPALMRIAGGRIDGLRRRTREKFAARPPTDEGRLWAAWSRGVQRRPWPAIVVSLAILLGLAAPALGMRLGSSDAGTDPTGSTTRKAYDLISDGFGKGVNGTFLVVVELPRAGDSSALAPLRARLSADPGIVSVSEPRLSPDRGVATLTAVPRTSPQDKATTTVLRRLRNDVIPRVESATNTTVSIGGITATQEDFTRSIADKLPYFVGIVVLLSALLLMAVFRSVLLPVKAAIMNLLSIGAALGFVTLVFQHGFGAGLLGIQTGPIESFLPVMLFAIVFGLSMDYEVFLLSRVHEEWEHTGDAHRAVRQGLAATGRVITAAATIMVVVFGSFAIGDDRIIKLFGIGLA